MKLSKLLPLFVFIPAVMAAPASGQEATSLPVPAVSTPVPRLAVNPALSANVSKVTYKQKVLSIYGTADTNDSMSLTCSGDAFTVNGVEPIDGATAKCSTLEGLRIFALAGTDSISASLTPVMFPKLASVFESGGPGLDNLTGWPKKDVMDGGGGNDVCNLLEGPGSCTGGKGSDKAVVQGANPSAVPGLLRASGKKVVVDSVEIATLSGSGGDDTINAKKWDGSTWLYGNGGNDTIFGSKDQDNIIPGSGNDDVFGMGGHDSLVMDSGLDSLDGGAGVDSVRDSMGTTTVTLSDTVATDSGLGATSTLANIEDAFFTGNTSGSINLNASGWTGASYLMGGAGNDTIVGGSGADRIGGYLGTDTVTGGGGSDTLVTFTSSSASFTLSNTQLTGAWGTDGHSGFELATFFGGSGTDTFNAAAVTSLRVFLTGNGGTDTLSGGSLADDLSGGDGNDILNGNGGDDVIDGGAGTDTCSGGAGTNTLTTCP